MLYIMDTNFSIKRAIICICNTVTVVRKAFPNSAWLHRKIWVHRVTPEQWPDATWIPAEVLH